MPDVKQQSTTIFEVKVEGRPIAEDMHSLMSYVLVEDNLNLPDMCVISFLDPNRVVLAKIGAKAGAKLSVTVKNEAYAAGELVFDGEVTALEAEYDGGRTHTVVRCLDKSNRLYRGRHTRTFKDVKNSDVVRKVAAAAGLQVGKVETSPESPRRHVMQANMTDADFLAMLAAEVGFILEVDLGKVNFYKPPASTSAPSTGRMAGPSTDPLQLTHGDNLLRYSAVITSDSQAKEVVVRGWDLKKKEAVIGKAPVTTTSAQVGVTATQLASTFGGATFTAVDVPYSSADQVQAAARSLAEQIAGTHAQVEGVARGNPKLRAGTAVSLGQVGIPFEGKYTLTATRHVFDNGEYVTHFSSTGRRDRSLLALTSGGGPAAGGAASVTAPVAGVMVGVVTNNKDVDGVGQVKVKFPRLDDSAESDWIRLVQPGAGKGRGAMVLPEVNDEVLVAFENGDPRRGYVLGGLYNGVDKPNDKFYKSAVGGDGKVNQRSFTSRQGHFQLFSDEQGKEFVQVSSVGEEYFLKLNKTEGVVLVSSKNLVTIDAQGDVTVKSKQNVTVEATRDVTVKGTNVTIEAKAALKLKGATVNVEGTGATEVKGASTKVAGTGSLNLESSGIAVLKGILVKIN